MRQHVQRGIVVIPKGTHKERMAQNLDLSVELADKERGQLKALLCGDIDRKGLWGYRVRIDAD